MITLGTTGTRHIANEDKPRFVQYLLDNDAYFSMFDMYVSGACIGWDAVFGRTMAETYSDQEHVVIVPADQSRVDAWWEDIDVPVTVINMPEKTSYRDRNLEIVKFSNVLFYCADYPEANPRSLRSGTWMTVRLARNAGLEVNGIIIHE